MGSLQQMNLWTDDHPYINTQHMKKAGLSEIPMLYMRSEAKDLWSFLDSNSGICLVQGVPGIGKSSLIWAWACYHASQQNKKIVWLNYGAGFITRAVFNEEVGKISSTMYEDEDRGVFDDVKHFDVCIVDGIVSDKFKRCFGPVRVARGTDCMSIFVTSYSTDIKCQFVKLMNIKKHKVYSWTLEQYKSACKLPEFFDSIKENLIGDVLSGDRLLDSETSQSDKQSKDSLLDSKFYLAGSSAWWFFWDERRESH